ncbi:hypothetical protein PGT21_006392 [Puccinia graminis f. sp. tritici]|uniref:Uncharacterized protein n=1 Tax=Puccinia graminis f. sp. tritici TaxID=56615 RepID=A0A5B0PQ81_PUCGR|nr:hypothetical protein PGT21_006392 [Puccinia graminis f. sp. tritici]
MVLRARRPPVEVTPPAWLSLVLNNMALMQISCTEVDTSCERSTQTEKNGVRTGLGVSATQTIKKIASSEELNRDQLTSLTGDWVEEPSHQDAICLNPDCIKGSGPTVGSASTECVQSTDRWVVTTHVCPTIDRQTPASVTVLTQRSGGPKESCITCGCLTVESTQPPDHWQMHDGLTEQSGNPLTSEVWPGAA